MTFSLLLTACLALPVLAPAQTVVGTTGVITGRVIDATGAVLAGVTVTLSSDALIADRGTRTTVTDEQGVYRFVALAPGEYTLAFERDGFTALAREGIYVAAGVSVTIDAALAVALHERVVVERGSPAIDRHTTAATSTFDARLLADLPWARSMGAILAATPSIHVTRVDVGGNTEHPGSYGAYGTNGQNLPMVEGMNVSGILGTGFTLDHGSFEEVTVSTAAHGAEWRLAGVHVQFIVRSGGNRYRGTMYAHSANRDWQSFNIDENQARRGAPGGDGVSPRQANRLWSQYDVNADVGGFVRKDTLWWYGSFRDDAVSARVVNFPVKPRRTRNTNYLAKGTYRPTPDSRLVAFGQTGRNQQPNRLDPFGPGGGSLSATTAIHEAEDSTAEQLARGRLWKVEWNSVVEESLFFAVRTGQFSTSRSESPNGIAPRFEDIGNQQVHGGSRDWQHDFRRDQVTGSMNYFKTGALGNHDVTLGGEVLRITSAETWRRAYPGDVLHVLQDGAPREVYLFETPSKSESGLWLYSAYASDSWRVHRRLTVNLGLRFDRSRVFLPEQVHPAGRFNATEQRFAAVDNVGAWNALAPRVSLVHALTGDGKTLAKVSYGRYSLPPGTDVGANTNPNAVQWWRSYQWSDPDGSRLWEQGEEGRLLARRGGVGIESLDPDLELPYVTEAAGWLEREVPGQVGIRTGIVWRGTRRQRARRNINRPFDAFSVPVLIPDPGPDGSSGTADDRPAIQAFELTPDRLDPDMFPPVNIVGNVAGSDGHYWTWDASATRRFNGRWSFAAGLSHIWRRDHGAVFFGQAVRNNALPLTPNDLIHAGPQGRHEFTSWTARAYGTYHGPWGLRIAPLLRHQSGQPFGRTLVASLNYGNVRILAEPVGTRRMDHITILDLHVEKAFRPRGRRVAAFADVFNVMNANPEESVSWSSGASFLRPLSVVAPRIARIGAKLQW